MSTIDEMVRDNILRYPGIFKNRSDVLHHILCVLGNGFRWSDAGEPVEDVTPEPYWTAEAEYNDDSLYGLRTREPAFYENFTAKLVAERQLVVDQVDTRMHVTAPIEDFYMQTEHALLMNVPNNVTPEWKEACESMKQTATREGSWRF